MDIHLNLGPPSAEAILPIVRADAAASSDGGFAEIFLRFLSPVQFPLGRAVDLFEKTKSDGGTTGSDHEVSGLAVPVQDPAKDGQADNPLEVAQEGAQATAAQNDGAQFLPGVELDAPENKVLPVRRDRLARVGHHDGWARSNSDVIALHPPEMQRLRKHGTEVQTPIEIARSTGPDAVQRPSASAPVSVAPPDQLLRRKLGKVQESLGVTQRVLPADGLPPPQPRDESSNGERSLVPRSQPAPSTARMDGEIQWVKRADMAPPGQTSKASSEQSGSALKHISGEVGMSAHDAWPRPITAAGQMRLQVEWANGSFVRRENDDWGLASAKATSVSPTGIGTEQARPMIPAPHRLSELHLSPPVPDAYTGGKVNAGQSLDAPDPVQFTDSAPRAQPASMMPNLKSADAMPAYHTMRQTSAPPSAFAISAPKSAEPNASIASTDTAARLSRATGYLDKFERRDELRNAERIIAPQAVSAENPPPASNRHSRSLSDVGSLQQIAQRVDNLPRIDSAQGDRADSLPLRLEAVALASTAGIEIQTQRIEASRFPSPQVVEHLLRQPERAVEISLHPRELGRVHMALASTDVGTTLTITADRPETLDLMRRHIEQLAQEFKHLGHGDVGFAFRQGGADGQAARGQGAPMISGDAEGAPELAHPEPMASSGLDLRL